MVAVLLVPVAIVVAGTLSAADSRTLDDCDSLVRDHPQEWTSYKCYKSVNARPSRADAVRRLEALLQIHPERHAARFYAADILGDMEDERAFQIFRELAEQTVADGSARTEAKTRKQWAFHLTQRGRFAEAESELARAEEAAKRSNDDAVMSEVKYQQGWTSLRQGGYGHANVLFHRARQLLGPDGAADRRANIFNSFGAVAWLTGEYAVAVRHYEEAARLYREAEDLPASLKALSNRLGVARSEYDVGRMKKERLEKIARELLAAASEKDVSALCRAHSTLGRLGEGEEARQHLLTSVDVARGQAARGG